MYAPETLRSTAASAEVTIVHGQQVLELKVMRPARRIELALTTKYVAPAFTLWLGLGFATPTPNPKPNLTSYGMADVVLEAMAKEARKKVEQFMIDNDVFFNGAAEKETQASPLGTAQAWHIVNLDPKITKSNRKTIAGIAKILREPDYKDLYCEVGARVRVRVRVRVTG